MPVFVGFDGAIELSSEGNQGENDILRNAWSR